MKGVTNSEGITSSSLYKGEWVEGQSYEVGDIVHVIAWGDPQNMKTGFYICRVAGTHDPYSGDQDGWYWLQISNEPLPFSQISGSDEYEEFQPLLMSNSNTHDGSIKELKHYPLIGPAFQKLSRTPASATATQTAGTSLTNITVNANRIFNAWNGTQDATYNITYDGTSWYRDGYADWTIYYPSNPDYSVLSFEGTPEAGIEIEIDYTAPVDKFLLSNTKTEGLVTSISDQSTDEEYPSAKAVYDIVGNIEAALQEV